MAAMRKYYAIAAAVISVLATAACTLEMIPGADEASTVKITVSAEAGMPGRASLGSDNSSFCFEIDDEICWNSTSGNAVQMLTEDTNTAVLDMSIPGLATGNVTGWFSYNVDGVIPFSQAASANQYEAGFLAYPYLASKKTTIKKGTEELTIKLGIAGGIIRVFPYSSTRSGEKVKSVSISSSSPFTGDATWNADAGECTYTASVSSISTTLHDAYTLPSAKGEAIFFFVPQTTITAPAITVVTNKATYTFQASENLSVASGNMLSIPLNLDKAVSSGGAELLDLSAATILTNAPMRYSTWWNNCDANGMGGDCGWANWFYAGGDRAAHDATLKQNRQTYYGTVSNLWDGDPATSFHTNVDWASVGDASWPDPYDNNVGRHIIQVTPNVSAKKFNVWLKNDNCPSDNTGDTYVIGSEGIRILARKAGGTYTDLGTYAINGAGAEANIEGLALPGGDFIDELRFERNKDAGWTYCANAFGIAEMKIWSVGETGAAGTPSDVNDANPEPTPGPGPGPGPGPDPIVDPEPSTAEVPVSRPSAPAGYHEISLASCDISTNNPLQYVSYGYSTPDGWIEGPNQAITSEQKAARQARYDRVSNMWDGDKATCYHTNFDVYEIGWSWAPRSNALVFDNYILVKLPEKVRDVCIWICNPTNGERMGYTTADTEKGHYHAYIEFTFSDTGAYYSAGSPWAEAAPYEPVSEPGSQCMWNGLTCSTFAGGFQYIKIAPHVGETSSGTFDGQKGFFGIAELAIFAR